MSLPAPASLTLTQDGPTVDLSWSSVTGADYYIVRRYLDSVGSGTASEIAQTTGTTLTDYAVPIAEDDGTGTYSAAVWRYQVLGVDGSGEGAFIDQAITMTRTTVANVQAFDIRKPTLADGTQYDYDQISFGSTDSNDQDTRDSVFFAYLKSIET